MSTDNFNVDILDGIAFIRLSNPPVNAITFSDWMKLPALMDRLESDPHISCVIFSGIPGKHFSAGNDFREFNKNDPVGFKRGTVAVQKALRRIKESELTTLAAIHGAALGSAFMLACACDIRIGTAECQLGLPEVKVGAFGGYRLVREVLPEGEARLMVLTGRTISGERAYQLGLLQKLVDHDQLFKEVFGLAREFSSVVKKDFHRKVKPLINRVLSESLWDGYDTELSLGFDYAMSAVPNARTL
jgi:enoyl-CoA hydratase/carnithine racemase